LAERSNVYALGAAPDAVAATGNGVDRVVVTFQDVSWSTDEWRDFASGMARQQFVLTYENEGVKVYTRLSSV
jgi:hypothetical protein